MNPAAQILELQGQFQPLIKKLANKLGLPWEDAQQQARLACCLAVQSFDSSRGTLDAWVASTICNQLKRLAFGHDEGDALRFAAPLDDFDLAAMEKEQDDREIPALSGIYGRIRALAVAGFGEEEIAVALKLSKRRIQQLLKDADGIRAAAALAAGQADLFGGAQA